MSRSKRALIALHDVTPFHAARLERAERLLTAFGIASVAYLFVPAFHGRGDAHGSPEFTAWCRGRRGYDVQWFLHGYFHSERVQPIAGARLTVGERLARRYLTDGEGEFLPLRGQPLAERLEAGVRSVEQCLGRLPAGFVAPAWLFNDELIPALARAQLQFTESQRQVTETGTGRTIASPVITWATRTRVRLLGSIAVSSVQRRLWRSQRLLRVALHPYDFDHPATVASISRTLEAVRRTHVVSAYDDALFEVE